MKKHIVKMKNGDVRVVTLIKKGAKIEDVISKWEDHADVDSHKALGATDSLPADRVFRDAWKLGINGCVECPVKSREIIRKKRNKKLEYLDEVAIKESRKPVSKLAEVNTKAQELRDIPQSDPRFAADDIDGLKAIFVELDDVDKVF